MLSPARLVKLGLPEADVAALYGLTAEQLDAILLEDERRVAASQAPPPAGKTLMTRLLLRPDLDRWETRRAER